MRDILIAVSIKRTAADIPQAGGIGKRPAQRMILEFLNKHLSQFLDTEFVIRITDIEYFSIADIIPVLDDSEQAFYAIAYVGKTPPLVTAIYQQQGSSFHQA